MLPPPSTEGVQKTLNWIQVCVTCEGRVYNSLGVETRQWCVESKALPSLDSELSTDYALGLSTLYCDLGGSRS